MGITAEQVGRLRARYALHLIGQDELFGAKIGDTDVLDDYLVAIAEIDLNIVADLARGIDQRLKGRNVEVADVDAIAGIQMLNRVHAHALAEQELVVAFVAAQFVAAGTAKEQISAEPAMQF